MWKVKSESGPLHAVLIQDSIEGCWERKLPFVGSESSLMYVEKCVHADYYEGGRDQWRQLPRFLRENGIKVFEVISLLREILEKATIGEKKRIIDEVWEGMPNRPEADELTVEHLIEGYPTTPYFDNQADRVVLPDFKRVTWPYPRDTSFTTQVGTVLCSMRRYSRRYEPRIIKLLYEYDSILSKNMGLISDMNDMEIPSTEPLCIEGGDVHIVDEETIAIGIGQRSTFTGFMETMKRLFKYDREDEIRYICAVNNADYPAVDYMHLDTTVNYPDRGKALVMPYYWDSELVRDMPKKRLLLKMLEAVRAQSERDNRPMAEVVHPAAFENSGRCTVYTNKGGEPHLLRREISLIDFLIKEGKLDADGIIYVGGVPEEENDLDHLMRALMEQARGAANIFTIKPGLVIAYKRNRKTLEALEEHGIRVKRWSDSYLDMLGGPHCSTSPLCRDAA